jgi:hypothetical protein
MTDRDLFDLEMSPGVQPPSGLGDRILVFVAGIALVGGLVIAMANALPDAEEVAQASVAPSSTPARTPQPSPTPAPPRVVTIGQPPFEVQPVPQSGSFNGWIRAEVDVVVHVVAKLDGAEAGVLRAGDFAYADQQNQPADEPGWLYLQPPAPQGWIATIDGGTPLVTRFSDPHYSVSGFISSLTAGPDGFVALAFPPGDNYTYGPARPVVSADGAVWRSAAASTFAGADVSGLAFGPAGWLAVGTVSGASSVQVWLWSSPDGLTWTRLGAMTGLAEEYPGPLLGSDHGYLLQTWGGRLGGTTMWTSADGVAWREVLGPLVGRSEEFRDTIAVRAGFYSWNGPSSAAFSADGRIWTAVADGPGTNGLRMSGLDDRIVAIDISPKTRDPQVWLGSVVGGSLSWSREVESDGIFAGAVVTQVVSRGNRAFAFGWDRSTDAPVVWTGDGLHWLRAPLPAAFGGIPQDAAAGPAGVVALGHRPTLRGDNPIVWHRTAVGAWLPEELPMLEFVPNPGPDACPAVPRDALEFFVLDVGAAITCFGDAPITFRAWAAACDGCSGGWMGASQPSWLLNPTTNQLYLSPLEANGDWMSTVVVDPSLEMDPTWSDAQLELTGHFDDPAAATCHYEPTSDELVYWSGQQQYIDQCRRTFVVTEVTVVSRP